MEMKIVFTDFFFICYPNIDVKDTRWKDIFKMMTYHDAQGIIEIPLTSLTLTLIVGKL